MLKNMPIQSEMPAQLNKWGGNMGDWQAAVQDLKDFISDRCLSLENGLMTCFDLTGPYETTFEVYPPEAGVIKVNSIDVPVYPWTTRYTGGVSTLISATQTSIYQFDHWEVDNSILDSLPESILNSLNLGGPETIRAVFREDPDLVEKPIIKNRGFGLPNAFSPNGDGNNDVYRPLIGEEVESFTLSVYDRWGDLLFRTSNKQDLWDGTYRGQKLAGGSYVYVADVLYTDTTFEKLTGNLTILR